MCYLSGATIRGKPPPGLVAEGLQQSLPQRLFPQARARQWRGERCRRCRHERHETKEQHEQRLQNLEVGVVYDDYSHHILFILNKKDIKCRDLF